MTTPSTPDSAVKALRPLFAWALLGYVALHLFFEFLSWIVPSRHDTFVSRSYYADFVGLYTIVLPLLAVLIATQISPVLAASKLLAGIALIEYTAVLFFGVITLLIGLGEAFTYVDTASRAFDGLRHLVMGLVELGIVALAGFAVLRVFTALGGKLPNLTTAVRQEPPAGRQEPPAAHRAE